MNVSDATVMAYVDGELDPGERAAFEAALAIDTELARRVSAQRALTARLRGAFQPVIEEPVPERLLSAVRGAPTAAPSVASIASARATRTERKERAKRRWAWPEFGAIAASVAVGLLVGHFVLTSKDPLISRDGDLVADGVLASALSNQLAANQSRSAPVRIGVSFRSKNGDLCRTFALHGTQPLTGLACRDREDWRIDVLARGAAGSSGAMEQAGSAMPEVIARAVDASITGEAFDAAAEEAARRHQWRE